MDRYAEVEAKFDADSLSPAQVQDFVDGLSVDIHCETYKRAVGEDFFFRLGEGVFRFRRDAISIDRTYPRFMPKGAQQPYVEASPHIACCLTVKERKSTEDLLNRREVDLWIGPQETADVRAFVGLLGGTELFNIHKSYHVWMLEEGDATLCLALYDVCRPDGSEGRRFLEIEVEKHSQCSPAEGEAVLQTWITRLRDRFGLEAPVNVSLAELYGRSA